MKYHEKVRLEMTEERKRLRAAASFAAADAERSKREIAKVEGGAPPGGPNVPHSAGLRMIKLRETMQSPVGHRPLDDPLLDAWFELNYRLQEEAIDAHINKTFVEQWMMRLWTIVSPRPQCFWLFLARINELALLCASRYVDCCEFAAADELLVQPSSALLHFEGGGSAAFQHRGEHAGRGRECILVDKKAGPLLPGLYDLLSGSGHLTMEYLLSVFQRNEKIAQVAGMLSKLGMHTTEDISMKLSCMDVDKRGDFRSGLCLFDRKTFNELGRALHLFMQSGKVDQKYVGKYLLG
jgi:hypothetical protein